MFDGFKPQLIHRPGCVPGNRDPKCACQKIAERQKKPSTVWRDLGYESEEDYLKRLKKIASRDKPLFKCG